MTFLDSPWARRGSGILLLGYLTALITGTHLPHPDDQFPIDGNDKLLHFGAYCGLAFLMATRLQTLRPVTWRAALAIGVIAALTAVADELTQMLPGINRRCEFADWLADLAGLVCGLLIWFGLRRLFRGPEVTLISPCSPRVFDDRIVR